MFSSQKKNIASSRTGITRHFSNLPLQLFVLFVILFGAIWTGIYLQLQSTYAHISQNVTRDGANLARAFAEQAKASVRAIDLSLLSLREEWRSNPGRFHEAVVRQQTYLVRDIVFQVGVIDADGVLRYSNLAPQKTPVSLADREHFRVHRDRKSDQLFISKPLLGRVSGRWSIQFTRPILGKDQEFLGVMVMSVAPEYFTRFHDTLNLDKAGTISLVKSDGHILARAPNPEQGLGRSLSGRPFQAEKAAETGSFRDKAQTDGVERYYSWRQIKDFGLIAVIGQSAESTDAPYYLQRNAFLAGGAAASVLLLLFAAAIVASLRQRAAALAALEASEERNRLRVAALEAVGNAVVITDPQARIEWVNGAFETLTGYNRRDAIGHRPSELIASGLQDKA
jgi:PAS domain-containing protein